MADDRPQKEDGAHSATGRVQVSTTAARMPESARAGVLSTGAVVLGAGGETVLDFLQAFDGRSQVVARVILPNRVLGQLVSALETSTGRAPKHARSLDASEESKPSPAQIAPSRSPAANPKVQGLEAADSTPEAHSLKDVLNHPEPADPIDGPSPGARSIPRASSGKASKSNNEPTEDTTSEDAEKPQREVSSNSIADLYNDLGLPDEMLGGSFANKAIVRNSGSEIVLDFVAQFYPSPVVSARVILASGRVPALLSALRQHQKSN